LHKGLQTKKASKSEDLKAFKFFSGGEGIRTLDTLSSIHTFQACQFNHSCTPPVDWTFKFRDAKIRLLTAFPKEFNRYHILRKKPR
jgi:hypothetical protein